MSKQDADMVRAAAMYVESSSRFEDRDLYLGLRNLAARLDAEPTLSFEDDLRQIAAKAGPEAVAFAERLLATPPTTVPPFDAVAWLRERAEDKRTAADTRAQTFRESLELDNESTVLAEAADALEAEMKRR